jgi:arylsulfatase A-like enzyme
MLIAWADQQPNGMPVRASLPIQPGSTITEPVHMDDFFATALDVAGVENPVPEKSQDGQTLVPLLSGSSFERRAPLFWHYPHQWYRDVGTGLGIEPFSAMRKGRYKVIYFYGDGVADGEGQDPRVEVYDLLLDLSETRNLATSQPKRCIALRDELVAWLAQVGAGIPIVNVTDKPADLPKPGSPLRSE